MLVHCSKQSGGGVHPEEGKQCSPPQTLALLLDEEGPVCVQLPSSSLLYLVCPTPPFLLPVELWTAWRVVWTTCLSKVLLHPSLLGALQMSRLCLSTDSSFPTTVDHTENCDCLSFKVRPGWWRKTNKVFSILGEWKQNVFSKPGPVHHGCPRCRVEDSVNKFTLDPANTAPNLPNICLKIKCIAPTVSIFQKFPFPAVTCNPY